MTKEEIIELIKKIFKTQPSVVYYENIRSKNKKLPSNITLQNKFGSWNQAWAEILQDSNALKKNKVWTKEEIINAVLQADNDLEHNFSNKGYENWRKEQVCYTPSVRTIERNFGSLAALCSELNIPYKSVPKKSDFTDKDFEKAIWLYIKSFPNGEYPVALGYRSFQKENPKLPSLKLITRRYGTWKEALKAINYQEHQEIVNIKVPLIKQEDCINAIINVFELTGYPITSLSYRELLKQRPDLKYPDVRTILRNFDTWDDAVLAAGLIPKKHLTSADIVESQVEAGLKNSNANSVEHFLDWCLK